QRDRARQAVDTWFTQVAERQLPEVPGMEKTRREFLIEARNYYEAEADEGNGSDPASRAELANACFRVGRIHSMLSEMDAAEHAYGRAIPLLEELAKDYPNEPDYRVLLARSLNELGLVNWTKSRRREAEEVFRRGLATAEASAAAFPDRPEN